MSVNSQTQDLPTPLLQEFPPLLRNRNFLLLWIGYVVSALGDRIQFLVALHLLCDQIWKPAILPGTQPVAQLTIAQLAPFALFGPFTGLLADRLPRRGVMITADLARVVIILAVRILFVEAGTSLSLAAGLILLFTSEFTMAIFAAIFSPARAALLPNLVHPNQLLRANSMTSAAGTIASLLGFVIGGILVANFFHVVMFVGAGTFLFSAICLSLMKIPPQIARSAEKNASGITSVLRELHDGILYMYHHKRTLQIIGLMLLFWSCGTIIMNGLAGIVTHYYGLEEKWYAFFMGAAGLGMMGGAAIVSLARKGIAKEVGIAWSMVGTGVFLAAFSLTSHWLVGMILLVGGAFMGAVLLVSLETLLQRIVPNYVRGRVMGVRDVVTMAGLVSAAIPLAINPHIDNIIRLILLVMSLVVLLCGLGLVVYYYRRQTLPLPAAIARRIVAAYLSIWQRLERRGACTIPGQGGVIVVANHTSGLDPLVLMACSPYRLIHFMVAKEYYEQKPFYYLYKALELIPVNRSGTDIASVRSALRTLQDGKVLGLFPEGGISMNGELQEGKSGVAMLALMSAAPVVPAYISGTLPHESVIQDFQRRAHLQVHFGRPLTFQQFLSRKKEKEALDEVTRQIMAAIATLRDKHHTPK